MNMELLTWSKRRVVDRALTKADACAGPPRRASRPGRRVHAGGGPNEVHRPPPRLAGYQADTTPGTPQHSNWDRSTVVDLDGPPPGVPSSRRSKPDPKWAFFIGVPTAAARNWLANDQNWIKIRQKTTNSSSRNKKAGPFGAAALQGSGDIHSNHDKPWRIRDRDGPYRATLSHSLGLLRVSWLSFDGVVGTG